jgi:hypothetical protein
MLLKKRKINISSAASMTEAIVLKFAFISFSNQFR